jgi:hypothetical protein
VRSVERESSRAVRFEQQKVEEKMVKLVRELEATREVARELFERLTSVLEESRGEAREGEARKEMDEGCEGAGEGEREVAEEETRNETASSDAEGAAPNSYERKSTRPESYRSPSLRDEQPITSPEEEQHQQPNGNDDHHHDGDEDADADDLVFRNTTIELFGAKIKKHNSKRAVASFGEDGGVGESSSKKIKLPCGPEDSTHDSRAVAEDSEVSKNRAFLSFGFFSSLFKSCRGLL